MSRFVLSRRSALALMGGAATFGLTGRIAHAAGEIKVLNWQGYGTDEKWALEMFEKKTGIKVVHDYFNSEQEMLTKLRTSPGTYDVVLMNNIYVMEAAHEGLIQPLDTSKFSNFGDLAPSLRDSDRFVMGGKHFAIAWVWGLTSFAYNTQKISAKPDTMGALWDPAHAGKVGWRDDALESIQIAALATGQDMNAPADLEKVKDKLKALKSQIKTFWSSEDEWNKYMAAGDYDIAVYWSGSAARSKKAMKLPVEFVVPKEGAIGWFDGLTIADKAPNAEGAAAFINFMVDPEFYVKWDNDIGAPASANAKANAQLPADALNRTVLGDPEVVKRVQWMAPVSDEQKQKNQELWDEVKTSFAL
ncbi:ABC transporter substrate-binding protein [Taklimakanibacter lacteus]|uniref:ABC transporter substrate-binding protein n=1 Tax=Taklimakanibacter lacteus TaxID=2268456 RepID=UPI000E67325E